MSRGLELSRRSFLMLGGASALLPFWPADALAELEREAPLYGISPFGELKYGPDFTHFDYVNLDAPKGGTFNFSPFSWTYNQSVLTFNTLNSFVPGGDAPPRMEMCFDSLFAGNIDEPASLYGLLAETVTISEDGNVFTFAIRPEARFHDDTPLTARDVAFTFNLYKEKGNPVLRLPLTEMTEALAVDDLTFRIRFSGRQTSRSLFTVASYPIMSEAFYTENPFDSSQLNAPLGSGPYRVGRFEAGRFIEYVRAEDYWARDLRVNRGMYHFDRLRIEFFRDRQGAFEAFKKGDIHYRQEASSNIWATGYDFPAIADGRVIKREFDSEKVPSMQAWALNQRRARFADVRVRRAIAMCFDFEWTNRNLFHGIYNRSNSSFEKSAFKAEGLPSPAELEVMERFREELPEEAFGEVYVQPGSDGSGRDRQLLQSAINLLTEAGWKKPEPATLWRRVLRFFRIVDALPDPLFVVDETGQRLTLEIMVQDDAFLRIVSPYVNSLRSIGIDASIRMVDSTQYEARRRDFDFDMMMMAFRFSALPARDGLFALFHSQTADINSSRNLPGTKSPVIDGLIDMAGAAASEEELTTILRVLDRVLRTRMDWIPNWFSANHLVSYWDLFGFDEPKPDYGFSPEALWWYDREKAGTVGRG